MKGISNTLRTLRYAALVGIQDFRAAYTWRTWLSGWLVRVLAQVVFFAFVGSLLRSHERTYYLLIGNTTMLASISALLVISWTTWERRAGTLSLLIAAPTSALPVLLGRSVQWVVDGALISSIAFYGVGLLFRLPMRWPNVLLVAPLLVVVAATTYMFGAFLAALVLQRIGVRNLAFNITYLAMMSICGVNVPVTFLPGWLQTLANLLPLTHGLNAIRALLSGSPVAAVVGSLGMEVGVGLGWLTLAILVFGVTLEKTRMDGSLEFAD